MMGFVVTYANRSGRKRNLLVLAKSFEDAKKIAENYLGYTQKILVIKYVVPHDR